MADNVYFGDSKRDGAGGFDQSYGQPAYAQPSYSQPQYSQPYGGYQQSPAPAPAPASDFAMLEDDDSELPF